jgi:hypothetical protein
MYLSSSLTPKNNLVKILMLKNIQQLLSPLTLLLNSLSYVAFISLAYHKLLLDKLGILESSTTSAYTSTKDFWHQPVVERLGFGLIWGTMGMLAVAFIWLVINGLNDIQNARSLTRDYANVQDSSSQIYKTTLVHIAAGFSPLLIFPVSASVFLPLSYRLFANLLLGINLGSIIGGLASMLVGVIAISLINLSFKLMRTAFS